MRAPLPWATKNGSPPTPRNARTGLLTPPGITRPAAPQMLFASRTGSISCPAAPWAARVEEGALEPAPAVRPYLDAHEVALALVPAKAGDRVDLPAHYRR